MEKQWGGGGEKRVKSPRQSQEELPNIDEIGYLPPMCFFFSPLL